MKTLKFLFIVFIASVFIAGNVCAQTDSEMEEEVEVSWCFNCNGGTCITGYMVNHSHIHYNPETGEAEWVKFTLHGDDLICPWKSETYKFFYSMKMDYATLKKDPQQIQQFHVIGDKGTHYIVEKTVKWDPASERMVVIKENLKCL